MAQATTKKDTKKPVEKNGVVYGFSIAALVLICITTFILFISDIVNIAALVNSGALDQMSDSDEYAILGALVGSETYVFLMGIGGIITLAIFVGRYSKQGYDMKGQLAFAIVFIVFAVIGGWGIFTLVTGILGIIFRNKPEDK